MMEILSACARKSCVLVSLPVEYHRASSVWASHAEADIERRSPTPRDVRRVILVQGRGSRVEVEVEGRGRGSRSRVNPRVEGETLNPAPRPSPLSLRCA